jgi:hypothetical protein
LYPNFGPKAHSFILRRGFDPEAARRASAGDVEDSDSIGNMRPNAEFPCDLARYGQIAQLVEQWTENPCVAGSIPALPINDFAPANTSLSRVLPVESPFGVTVSFTPPNSTELR